MKLSTLEGATSQIDLWPQSPTSGYSQ